MGSALLGDAGCMVSLLSPLRDQLGRTSTEIPRLSSTAPPPAAADTTSAGSLQEVSSSANDAEVPASAGTAAAKAASLTELQKMNLAELKKEARRIGIPGDIIQKADDQDDENQFLIDEI